MGFFGFGDRPSYSPPKPIHYDQAPEFFRDALAWAKKTFPQATMSREKGLRDIRSLEASPEYYAQYGPTSFEEALGNQYFQNIIPDLEASIKHNLSLSGMYSSPILAEQIAQARGRVGYDVGKYLADLAQRRAELGIQGRQAALMAEIGIDPASVYGPYLETDIQQSNLKSLAEYQGRVADSQAGFQNALSDWQSAGSLGSLIGSGIGAIGGSFFGAPMIGASIGGSLGGAMAGGGAGSPIGFQDALALSNLPTSQPVGRAYSNPAGYVNTSYGKSYYPGGKGYIQSAFN